MIIIYQNHILIETVDSYDINGILNLDISNHLGILSMDVYLIDG